MILDRSDPKSSRSKDAFKNKAFAKRIARCAIMPFLPYCGAIRMVATALRMVFKGVEHVNLSPHSMAKSRKPG
jgi:hypothetical protein